MVDILSPPSFQSKLFEPIPLSDKALAAPPYERPASGILRPGYAKNGDGTDLTMTQPTLQRYRRHRDYYITGGDIVFLVGSPSALMIEDRPISHHTVRESRSKTCFFVYTGPFPLPELRNLELPAKTVTDNSYFFERESPVFRKQLAGYGTRERSGGSDADPCVLDGVNVDDFSRFLWVFYNP